MLHPEKLYSRDILSGDESYKKSGFEPVFTTSPPSLSVTLLFMVFPVSSGMGGKEEPKYGDLPTCTTQQMMRYN